MVVTRTLRTPPSRLGFSTGLPRALLVAALLGGLTALAGCSRGAMPLPPESLQIRINLLCTTCDDFLRCEQSLGAARTDDAIDPAESYRIYRLREKGFWAQIATIWDYLVQWVHRKTSDTRPLTVYLDEGGRRRSIDEQSMARVDVAAGLISLPDSSIDMRDGTWRDLRGELQGRCATLPRREGYAWVRAMLGRELPGGGR